MDKKQERLALFIGEIEHENPREILFVAFFRVPRFIIELKIFTIRLISFHRAQYAIYTRSLDNVLLLKKENISPPSFVLLLRVR